MKARNGFTLLEILLAGAILATISFGALIGTIRVSDFVDKRGELMAADGFCWDVAWKIFNDYDSLNAWVSGRVEEYPRPEGGNAYLEIRGKVLPVGAPGKTGDYEFLPFLQYPGSPPECVITLSNRYDSASQLYDQDGIYISINLEWGPANRRRSLVRRSDTPEDAIVFDHPITLYCSKYSKRYKGL